MENLSKLPEVTRLVGREARIHIWLQRPMLCSLKAGRAEMRKKQARKKMDGTENTDTTLEV